MSNLFDKTTSALGKSLDMRLLRHNVTSGNIANAETPGYVAKKVDFEKQLVRALEMENLPNVKTTSPAHNPKIIGSIDSVQADIYENPEANITNDGNTVDLEKEMASLTENSILYKAAIEMIKKKMGSLKYAISEGGR